ncbi:MAG: hypothetical protein WBN56_07660 [Robiginitalea sp.]|uniref:hypothetical protein n=1 Tax=Robiginitalea sp. TaxID=1902411 RepID=UPI003C75040A
MNKCTTSLLLLLSFLLTGSSVIGQHQENSEQIKTLKIAFFTEKLELTPEEASVFWPIYNAHENAKEALRAEQRKEIRDRFETLESLSETEAKNALARYLELEEKEEELDKAYYKRISNEFSAVRTLKLFQAEQEFRRRLLQEYRKRKGSKP